MSYFTSYIPWLLTLSLITLMLETAFSSYSLLSWNGISLHFIRLYHNGFICRCCGLPTTFSLNLMEGSSQEFCFCDHLRNHRWANSTPYSRPVNKTAFKGGAISCNCIVPIIWHRICQLHLSSVGYLCSSRSSKVCYCDTTADFIVRPGASCWAVRIVKFRLFDLHTSSDKTWPYSTLSFNENLCYGTHLVASNNRSKSHSCWSRISWYHFSGQGGTSEHWSSRYHKQQNIPLRNCQPRFPHAVRQPIWPRSRIQQDCLDYSLKWLNRPTKAHFPNPSSSLKQLCIQSQPTRIYHP